MKHLRAFAALWAFLLFGSPLLYAQDLIPVIAKEHSWLWQLEGEWIFEGELNVGAEAKDKTQAKIIMTSKRLGDLWIICESACEAPGVALKENVTLGYDPKKYAYLGIEVNSRVNAVIQFEGDLDAHQKVLTLESDGPKESPSGTIPKLRHTYEFKSKDHYLLTTEYQTRKGEWVGKQKFDFVRKK